MEHRIALAAMAVLVACGALAQAARDTPLAAATLPAATPAATPATEPARAAAGLPGTLPRNLVALSILNPDGTETLGVKTPAGVVDVAAASRALALPAPATLEALLRGGSQADLDALVSAAVQQKVALVNEASIKHGRLLTNPGKIVCVGLNYRQHAAESGAAPPRLPPLFNKYNNAPAAHGATVKLPAKDLAYKIDYETELLVVIGKAARDVSVADALNYVAGYSIGHDLSARDLQLELPAGQWMIGKTLDGFAPIGPYFVSSDLVRDPDALHLETRVNGVRVQSDNTKDFIFDVPYLVSYISKHFTLQPGDIIFTGTPAGVILGRPKSQQLWLKAGDEVVSVIDKLGELRFTLA